MRSPARRGVAEDSFPGPGPRRLPTSDASWAGQPAPGRSTFTTTLIGRRPAGFADLTGRCGGLACSTGSTRGLGALSWSTRPRTPPSRWAILRALSDEFFSGTGPTLSATARLGRSIFVVGDEKQSIFSFQGAAPERLRDRARLFPGRRAGRRAPVRPVPLLASRRSTTKRCSGSSTRCSHPRRAEACPAARRRGPDRAHLQPGQGRIRGHGDHRPMAPWSGRTEAEPQRLGRAPRRRGEAGRLSPSGRAHRRRDQGAPCERGEAVHDRRHPGLAAVRLRRRPDPGPPRKRAVRGDPAGLQAARRAGGRRRPAAAVGAASAFDDFLALARFALFPDDDLTLAALLRGRSATWTRRGCYALAWREGLPGRSPAAPAGTSGPSGRGAAGLPRRWAKAARTTADPFELLPGC